MIGEPDKRDQNTDQIITQKDPVPVSVGILKNPECYRHDGAAQNR